MESKQPTRPGAARPAMRGIGQGSERRRWAVVTHRRPVIRARRTSLRSPCGQPVHGAKRASPANANNRSNDHEFVKRALEGGLLLIAGARRSNPPAQIDRFGALVILDADTRKNQNFRAGAACLAGCRWLALRLFFNRKRENTGHCASPIAAASASAFSPRWQ